MSSAPTLDSLRHDLRYAWRALATQARFTALVALTLALTIGAATTVFSVVNAVLLRPLPYADSDRLVWLWSVHEQSALQQRASFPDFRDWREQTRTLDLVGYGGTEMVLTGAGEPERLRAELFVGDLFGVLGVAPVSGAVPVDARDGPVAVLSHALWERSFGADAAIVGRTITLGGAQHTVAAVMPAGFEFPVRAATRADVWVPLERFNPALAQRRDARLIEVLGRLRAGASLADARAELDVIAANLAAQYPETNRGSGVRLVPALDEVTGGVSRGLLLLGAAVGALLLIGCVNVASLLVARTLTRGRELAVRAALGASRRRIARQLLLESLLLAAAGGVLGALLAVAAVGFVGNLLADMLPRAAEIAVDADVLAIAGALSLLTGLLFGVAPALGAARASLTGALNEGSHTASQGVRGRRVFASLVAVEMMLAATLLVVAGSFVHSFLKLDRSDASFDAANVLTFRLSLPAGQYPDPAAAFARLRGRLLEVPGVLQASTGIQLPDRGDALLDDTAPFAELVGRPAPAAGRPRVSTLAVQPGFLSALGIPLAEGRDFAEDDRAGSPRVVIVNRAFARAYLGGNSALGEKLRLDSWTLRGEGAADIVGVADDVAHSGLRATVEPMVYLAFAQQPAWTAPMVVRTRGDPLAFLPAVRTAIRALDPMLPIEEIATLEQRLSRSLAEDRFRALLLGAFSTLAVALAAFGLFAVSSYAMAQRVREIGIRMALGARADHVAMAVVGQALRPAAIGVLLGVFGAAAFIRLVAGLLFEVGAGDPVVLVTAITVLLAAAALASSIPARRAARTDPVTVLKAQ